MKPITKFFLCLILVVIGGIFLVDWKTSMSGIIVIGIFSYLAGRYVTQAIFIEEKQDNKKK